jgi:hypothetical protein
MKYLLYALFLLPITASSQSKNIDINSVYTGIYVSTGEGNFGFVQFENDIGLAILRCEYLTDFRTDNRFYMKMEFQVYHTDEFRFFVALPPFHWVQEEKGYNTPINFEVMFKNKLVLNLDVFKDNVNVSAQFRYKF